MDLIKKSWFSLLEEKSKVDNTKKFLQNEEKKQKKKMRSKEEKFKVKQIECFPDSLTDTFHFRKIVRKRTPKFFHHSIVVSQKDDAKIFAVIMELVLKQLLMHVLKVQQPQGGILHKFTCDCTKISETSSVFTHFTD